MGPSRLCHISAYTWVDARPASRAYAPGLVIGRIAAFDAVAVVKVLRRSWAAAAVKSMARGPMLYSKTGEQGPKFCKYGTGSRYTDEKTLWMSEPRMLPLRSTPPAHCRGFRPPPPPPTHTVGSEAPPPPPRHI